MPLSPALRRQLRARAHAMKPVVLVGEAGLSEGVLAEADRALLDHELIKVRLPAVERAARARLAEQLCQSLCADEVQAIGRIRVLYRPRPAEKAPRARARQSPRRHRRRPQR